MSDRYDLQRFVEAQAGGVHDRAAAELAAGQKRTHWMWFVFPQVAGLGSSAMAQHYALSGLDDARAYLSHAVLGPRLIACTQTVLATEGRSAHAIFGSPDDLKFRSSLTLFAEAAPDEPAFRGALDKYFHGQPDERTLAILRR